MTTPVRLGLFAAIVLAAATALAEPESDSEVNARKAALDLAGAFTNEGFKMRDGHWSGTIKPKDHALIAVNLYAGNHIWFQWEPPSRPRKSRSTFTTRRASWCKPKATARMKRRPPDFDRPAA